MASAFTARQRLVMGQVAVAEKIKDKKADCVISLKRNQGALHEDVKLFAAEQKARDFKDATVTRHKTLDGEHSRIETRQYTIIHDVGWLQQRRAWPGLAGVVTLEHMASNLIRREPGKDSQRRKRMTAAWDDASWQASSPLKILHPIPPGAISRDAAHEHATWFRPPLRPVALN